MAKKKAKPAEEVVPEEPVSEVQQQEAESEQIPKGQLGDWKDKVPAAVQKATEEYVASLREANKAKESMNNAKAHCLDVMEEFGVDSVPIDEGGKRLVRYSEMKLKTAKAEDDGEG